jgi:flagellar biosynthetic protein FliR
MIEESVLNEIIAAAPIFLLVAVRALAMIETAPLLSSSALPQAAKIALAGFAAFMCYRDVQSVQAWGAVDATSLTFVFLLIGEALIGIIMGFFMTIVFTAFSTAGQFFAFQMGFSMAESFDPLSQVENPLLGQYLNLVANLVFLAIGGVSGLFLGGFQRSLESLSISALIQGREAALRMVAGGLSQLFLDAAVIAMPIMGTLFLINLATGLISKAAPQVNILAEGFPISIGVAFLLMLASLPFMVEAFSRVINAGFQSIQGLLIDIGRPV